MRVFITGATGYIGSATVCELLAAGHDVVGLARSDAGAQALAAAGAEVRRGSLDDLESLRRGAEAADGVIHTAFKHDIAFSGDFAAAAAADLRAIEALGEALAGSDRPLVIASGTAGLASGRLATEDGAPDLGSPAAARHVSERTALALAERGVRSAALRLPPSVHGEGDVHGFLPILIGIARATGVSATVGDGSNRWPAVHRLDAARLFRLALESAPAGSPLHAVADEGVPLRDVAAVIGRHLGLPVVEAAADHFGWFGPFAAIDNPASSVRTRELLGWEPREPGLIADLDAGHYFSEAAVPAR